MVDKKLVRAVLASNVTLDPYLCGVAKQTPSHKFLGNATQGVVLRMVQLLQALYREEGRTLSSIKVLDWGAGKGHNSYLLEAAGFSVTSCDIDSTADDSSFGQETPIIKEKRIQVVPLRHPWQLPFDDGEFDLVVSFGVLEHVPHDLKSLQEIRRILKPGGKFFFSFLPYWLSWTQRLAHLRGNYYHPKLYDVKTVTGMAQDASFKLDNLWHGQLFPKNSFPHSNLLECVDRFLTSTTPLKYLATNLEGVLVAI